MWDIQIETYYKKEGEGGNADRRTKPESPSLLTQ